MTEIKVKTEKKIPVKAASRGRMMDFAPRKNSKVGPVTHVAKKQPEAAQPAMQSVSFTAVETVTTVTPKSTPVVPQPHFVNLQNLPPRRPLSQPMPHSETRIERQPATVRRVAGVAMTGGVAGAGAARATTTGRVASAKTHGVTQQASTRARSAGAEVPTEAKTKTATAGTAARANQANKVDQKTTTTHRNSPFLNSVSVSKRPLSGGVPTTTTYDEIHRRRKAELDNSAVITPVSKKSKVPSVVLVIVTIAMGIAVGAIIYFFFFAH